MFWNSSFFWVSFAVILVFTVICLVTAVLTRRKRLESKFTVEIENQGNVPSQFLLRLESGEDPEFQFARNGRRLPVEEIDGLPGPVKIGQVSSSGGWADQAQSASYNVTQYAPTAVSRPLVEANNAIYQGQAAVGQFEYWMRKLGLSGNNQPSADVPDPTPDDRWAVTDEIQPGKVLPVELTVRKKIIGDGRDWAFEVISRAREDEKAPALVQVGVGKITPGFWTRPVLPEVLIIVCALVLMIVSAALVSMSVF
jgi:hypothetical protein